MQRQLGFALLLKAVILGAFTATRFSPSRQIAQIELLEHIPVEKQYDKALFDPLSGSVYALSKVRQQIDIYRAGKLFNTLGGLGMQSYNFQRLADIAIDSDGSLLALDMMAKDLRRFSPEGQLAGRLELSQLAMPELLAMNPDHNLFIYDAAPQEIVCISMLDGSELYRFGRFQIKAPSSLGCTADYLAIYSLESARTDMYYVYGQFKESRLGQQLVDGYDNRIQVQVVGEAASDSAFGMAVSPQAGIASLYRHHISVVYPDAISIHRISYGGSAR